MSKPEPINAFNFIAEHAVALAGDAVVSHNPARPADVVWRADCPVEAVGQALDAARSVQHDWAAQPVAAREQVLRAFQEIARTREDELAQLIMRETGKALWDSAAEAKLIAGKVDITLDDSPIGARHRVAPIELQLTDTRTGRAAFRPHGVMAVIGPFNFPAHLPNGHIIPALLAGNTIVFKPSDKAPATGQLLGEMLRDALEQTGHPRSIVNVVHGGADVSRALTGAPHNAGPDGILFTGSWPVGRAILEANLDHPGRIVALEMGGNNPAVVIPDADLALAAAECVRAAFITTGQRCTCTRRLIVHESVADELIERIAKITSTLVIGAPSGVKAPGAGDDAQRQPVFMGPIITAQARDAVLEAQRAFLKDGANAIVEARALDHPDGGHYLSPGILRVDRFTNDNEGPGCDREVFGPLLRISVVDALDEAMQQANATRFGLAASIFTNDDHAIERFLREANAGCVNVNTGTAGASGKLPFGGLGFSGNHRPAGAFSHDYCAYPVASMIERAGTPPAVPGMTLSD